MYICTKHVHICRPRHFHLFLFQKKLILHVKIVFGGFANLTEGLEDQFASIFFSALHFFSLLLFTFFSSTLDVFDYFSSSVL